MATIIFKDTIIKPTTIAERRALKLARKQREMKKRSKPKSESGPKQAPVLTEKLERARARYFGFCLLVQGKSPFAVAKAINFEFHKQVTEESVKRWIDSGYPLQ